MPLINCEIDFILSWYERGFMIDAPIASQELTFIITDANVFVQVVTLSPQDHAKLL